MDIGHYGGMFVDVPAESISAFKKLFPKRQLPRRIQKRTVMKTLTPQGEARFHKNFPKSQGIFYTLFFADRSKGLKTLHKHYETWRYM